MQTSSALPAARRNLANHCSFPKDLIFLFLSASRCQSVSPPPLLSPPRSPAYPLSDSEDSCRSTRLTKASSSRLRLKDWSSRPAALRSTSTSPSDTDSPSHPLKAVSVGALDKRLSVFKSEDQKETPKEAQDGDTIGSHPLARSTLSLGTAANLRNLSLSRASVRSQVLDIRQKITEWECRRELSPRMSVCADKRDAGERSGSESCPSVLTSPCSEKTFDFKGYRRMSRTFSECSYPETEEEELLDRDSCIARWHCSILTEAARDQNRSRGTVVTCGLGDAFWLRSSEVFHQVEFKLHSAAFLAD